MSYDEHVCLLVRFAVIVTLMPCLIHFKLRPGGLRKFEMLSLYELFSRIIHFLGWEFPKMSLEGNGTFLRLSVSAIDVFFASDRPI